MEEERVRKLIDLFRKWAREHSGEKDDFAYGRGLDKGCEQTYKHCARRLEAELDRAKIEEAIKND